MYYVIQAYLFDAFFSAVLVDEEGNQTLRADITNYESLLHECYTTGVKRIVISGLNEEFLSGLREQVKILEKLLFEENTLEIEISQIAEVIPV